MNRFAEILAGIDDRLDLPQPQKFRIMREITADLEGAFEYFRAAGLSECEAEARAVERMVADDWVIEQLIEIHETPARRFLRSLSVSFRHRIETGLRLILLVTALAVAGLNIANAESLAGSPFAWLIGVLTAGMVSIAAARWYSLIIVRDHRPGAIHRGFRLLLLLAGLTALVGILGFSSELGHAAELFARTPPDSPLPPVTLFTRSFLIASLGLACAAAGAVMWFILSIRALSFEDQELAFRINRHS